MRRLLSNFAASIALWGMMAVPVTALAVDSTYNAHPSYSAQSSAARRRAIAKRRHRRAVHKTIKRVGIGAAGGAVAGAVIGGGPGAVVGGIVGAGAGTIYDQHEKDKGR